MADLQMTMAEQGRRRDEMMHAVELAQRDKDNAAELERSKVVAKLTEISDEVGSKMMQKEMKMRDEMQSRFAQLDKVRTSA